MVESDHKMTLSKDMPKDVKIVRQSLASNNAPHSSNLGNVSFLSGAILDLEQTNAA